jgi:hypothetical protein
LLDQIAIELRKTLPELDQLDSGRPARRTAPSWHDLATSDGRQLLLCPDYTSPGAVASQLLAGGSLFSKASAPWASRRLHCAADA